VDTGSIEKLARLRGISDAYYNYRGELQYFGVDIKAAILRNMGCRIDSPPELAAALKSAERWHLFKFMPSVISTRASRVDIELNLTETDLHRTLVWTLRMESGAQQGDTMVLDHCHEIWRGEVDGVGMTRRRFELPCELPAGYHDLFIQGTPASTGHCRVIVSPDNCFEPTAIIQGKRLWGVSVQLYTLRSAGNWGMGDFHDLRQMIIGLALQGAAFIGLNPLHALAPADPQRCSPYSASNRHFLNVLYIAVPQVEEFQTCVAAQARVLSGDFAEQLRVLRGASHVDYAAVATLKFEILEQLYTEFCDSHLQNDTPRALKFRIFVQAGGRALSLHALFDALDRHFYRTIGSASGWMSWPQEYQDQFSEAVTRFAQTESRSVGYFLYLQWLAQEQLRDAQALAQELGMPIGLYGDYAVGANPSGSETWACRNEYVLNAQIGAPPDPLALKGQGWGIPPSDPMKMQEDHLQGFVQLINSNMRNFGALRLDHVMSLFRLWWVAAGHSPVQGIYVHYPHHQLLAVLALESMRNRCLVVGEDLGVVPDEMRRAMPQYGLYHYKVLLFEKQDGRFRTPIEYAPRALATLTTHDMPTLRGFWEGRDLELRRQLDLYPSLEIEAEVRRERATDRVALLAALQAQGLAPASPENAHQEFSPQLAEALHLYLAHTKAHLVCLQLEDLLGMENPVNVPGTDREYPNWQRKITTTIEEMLSRDDIQAYFAEINRAREA